MNETAAAAKAALSHLEIDENNAAIRAKSRDFFWYSPILKDRLDHVVADFIVSPRTEAEVIEVLKACYAHDCPVTIRGAGTGNFGQAMPLAGGCVMHLRHMDKVRDIQPGRVIAEPGALLKDVDTACKEHSGQELRIVSSTWATATLGGFVAGGWGGVGSCTWGSLSDLGNILRLRVVTMEEEPRILDLTGEELSSVRHAYGTNGVITEIEMPLALAYDWVEVFVTTKDFMEAVGFAEDLANQDGILTKLGTVFEAPIAKDYFQRLEDHVGGGSNLIGLMVAPQSMDGFLTFLGRRPDATLVYRSDDNDWEEGPGPVFEYSWNHTTLRAQRADPAMTYLQVRYAYPEHKKQIEQMREALSPEVLQHLEVVRDQGKVTFAGYSLVNFTTEERLDEIIQMHEDAGAMIYNPHRYTLEEGGRRAVNERQLDFKREADPKGLLNPGKMIAWDDPDWAFDKMYAYPKLQTGE